MVFCNLLIILIIQLGEKMKISGILFVASAMIVLIISPCFAGRTSVCLHSCDCRPPANKRAAEKTFVNCANCVKDCCATYEDEDDRMACTKISYKLQRLYEYIHNNIPVSTQKSKSQSKPQVLK